jgi:hypothetical protein
MSFYKIAGSWCPKGGIFMSLSMIGTWYCLTILMGEFL